MKRCLAISILIFTWITTSAQYLPSNGQAFQFMPLYNPAFTGIENFADLKLSYRYQWTGYGSDAPKFLNIGFSTRLKHPLDLTYNAPRSSHSKALNPVNFPIGKTLIHGIGGNVFTESYGQINRTGVALNYSMNYALSKKLRMAVGLGVIYEGQTIDVNGLVFEDPDTDPQQFDGMSNQTLLSARAGLLLYSKSFYLGISYLPLGSTVIQSPSDSPQYNAYQASLQTGVSLPLTAELILKPSVIGLLYQDGGLQFDYSVKAFIRERLWLGVTYRDIESVVPMVGFLVSDVLTVSYAYEFSTSDFKQFGDSSHELVLSIRFNNFKKLKQYTW
jgi:type IX secretion system PorP/SprF family membrane protein